jgi:putative peptidoglycan lipid II flippase
MGQKVTITGVQLLLGSAPGTYLQVRAGNTASRLTNLPPVAHMTGAGGKVDVRLNKPMQGRYVLIWLTRLPPDTSGTFQAIVYDVTVEGRR